MKPSLRWPLPAERETVVLAPGERARQGQDRRAVAINTAVDTIILQPDSVVLRVGQRLSWSDFSVEARAAGGAVVPLVPRVLTEHPAIAQVTDSGIVARSPGRTRLVVQAFPRDSVVRPQVVGAGMVLLVRP
jgi:hypothetical protein